MYVNLHTYILLCNVKMLQMFYQDKLNNQNDQLKIELQEIAGKVVKQFVSLIHY